MAKGAVVMGLGSVDSGHVVQSLGDRLGRGLALPSASEQMGRDGREWDRWQGYQDTEPLFQDRLASELAP